MPQKATGGHDTSHVDKLRFSMQTRTSGSSEWLLPTAVVYHIIDCVRISHIEVPRFKTMGKSPHISPSSAKRGTVAETRDMGGHSSTRSIGHTCSSSGG